MRSKNSSKPIRSCNIVLDGESSRNLPCSYGRKLIFQIFSFDLSHQSASRSSHRLLFNFMSNSRLASTQETILLWQNPLFSPTSFRFPPSSHDSSPNCRLPMSIQLSRSSTTKLPLHRPKTSRVQKETERKFHSQRAPHQIRSPYSRSYLGRRFRRVTAETSRKDEKDENFGRAV